MANQNSPEQAISRGNKRVLHPNSLANLKKGKATEWKPGESGNPQGGSLKLVLLEQLEKPLGIVKPDAPAKELFVAAQLRRGIKGDKDACKEIWERADGKVTERQEVDIYVRQEAERVAKQLGISVEEVLSEAESIIHGD